MQIDGRARKGAQGAGVIEMAVGEQHGGGLSRADGRQQLVRLVPGINHQQILPPGQGNEIAIGLACAKNKRFNVHMRSFHI